MDAVSYAHSAKQAQRIEKFIEDPDSNSGVLTQPSVIQTGEVVTVPLGRTAILANTQIDGDLILDGDMFIPAGSSVDFSNGIKIDGNNIALSIPTSYHLLSGNLSVDNTVLTNGFGLYLYTGNTTTLPTINLGMDITSQWGNTADETYGYLIKIKSRSAVGDWTWVNSVRGITKYISSNTTAVEGTDANMFTLSTVAGVTTLNIGTSTRTNTNGVTYVVEVYQTTHRKTGVTNQGKVFTEHYNPDTGFTIEGYEGSGLAGHEIPHSLGRKLGFVIQKNLTTLYNWLAYVDTIQKHGSLNTLDAITNDNLDTPKNQTESTTPINGAYNTAGNAYVIYGWANSYFDESGKLIGNFEIGVYQGTGAAGNKVTTKGKPALVELKRLDAAENWANIDNQRNTFDSYMNANLSGAEATYDHIDVIMDGFIFKQAGQNISGGQYLYFGVYDNDNGSGKSKYYKATDTASVQINNGIIPLAHGTDSNGSKNSIVVANETITGLTYTEGKNYLYKTDTGYGVKAYKPRYLASELVRKFAGEQPDYYDVESNKWFNCDAGNIIYNEDFSTSTDIANWTSSNATISNSLGQLKVTTIASGTGYGSRTFTGLTVGKKYKIKATYQGATASGTGGVNIGSTSLGYDYGSVGGASVHYINNTFIATSTSLYITVYTGSGSTAGQYVTADNISVFTVDITPTTEITESRNYMNHIVYADADGGVLYVEELPKIEYKNVIKAEEYLGKNACTAKALINFTTTPPTIKDSYNISNAIRLSAGNYRVYFATEMDNINFEWAFGAVSGSGYLAMELAGTRNTKYFDVQTFELSGTAGNNSLLSLTFYGGKN